MNRMMKNVLLLILLLQQFVVAAQNKTGTGTVKIIVRPVFGSSPLKLQNTLYVDAHGDSLYIDEFRFYLSSIKFSGNGASSSEMNSYHLVDAADAASQVFYVKDIAAGTYSNLDLLVGVDSAVNETGANEGDLDPVKGMYWAWNTGYIMAKLQGRSSVCKTLHHAFEFHIGGYLPPYNASRKVRLTVPKLIVTAGKESTLYINADAAAWFYGPEMIDLSKVNEVNMPCKEAMMVADNYSDMLTVQQGNVK